MTHLFDSIADQLAGQGYASADRFLTPSEVDAIIAPKNFKETDHFKKAGIGQQHQLQINESIRGDYIQWIDKTSASPALSLYLERLEHLMQYLNETLFLSLKDMEVHKTVYPPGTFYKRHLDQFRKDDHRKLSVICYL
ncbi:MAG TPA: oxidoreductase, partial [Chryseosolibacter sp.]